MILDLFAVFLIFVFLYFMNQYLTLLKHIKEHGVDSSDRTGIWTRKVFGAQMRYDLQKGFPLVTTKKTFLRGIVVELIWLVRGETNIKYLVDRNVRIWNERPFQHYLKQNNLEDQFPKYSDVWHEKMTEFVETIKTKEPDDPFVQKRWDLWPVYGYQWRNFNGSWVDQLQQAVDLIRMDPESRRIIVNAWNPAQIDHMLLPPCHMFYQLNCDTANNKLHLQMYQRSCDMFLGVPFNIASYSTLLLLLAKITWYEPGTFVHTLGDAHIYQNHRKAVDTQLSREPFPLSQLRILKNIKTLEDIEQLEREDFSLENYQSHGRIKAPVAV